MLANNGEKIDRMAGKENAFSKQIVQPLMRFVRLQSFSGRAFGAITYTAGFAAFVWNTYQNQLPGVVVPYDFWDSSNHLWGFWATRVYKLYLFSWLLPYIPQVHVGILLVVLKAVRRARLAGTLKLNPFCPDGVGGLGFIPPLVTSPILMALVMCSVALAGAFEVHRKLDVTPSIGLAVLLGLSLGAYFVPTMYLRRDIVALKRTTFEKLLELQQEQYARIVDGLDTDTETLSRANEALDYFEKVRERVEKIPTLPHLKRVLNVVGIAITPSALSICVSIYDRLNPILLHLPQKP